MVNQLKMAKIDAILNLHQCNWSIRRIAKELGIYRGTVSRPIRLWKRKKVTGFASRKLRRGGSNALTLRKPLVGTLQVSNPAGQSLASSPKRVLRPVGRPTGRSEDSQC